MMTEERYEVIKKWGNFLFLFHNKEANADNKEKFKKLLQKIVQTNEFKWTTNKETNSVDVSFIFGKIEIQTESNRFLVKMDKETKRLLYTYKEKITDSEAIEKEKKIEKQEFPKKEEKQEKENQKPDETEEERKKSSSNSVTVTTTNEEKVNVPINEEIDINNSIFLDFIGAEEKGWM